MSVGPSGEWGAPSPDAYAVLGQGRGKDDAHPIPGELSLLDSVHFTARSTRTNLVEGAALVRTASAP